MTKTKKQIEMGIELRRQIEGHKNNMTIGLGNGDHRKIIFSRELVTELINNGADLEQASPASYQSPLGVAIHEHLHDIAAELIAAGANIQGGKDNARPIKIAAERGNIEGLHILMKAAKSQGLDVGKDLGLGLRTAKWNADMQKILISYGADDHVSRHALRKIIDLHQFKIKNNSRTYTKGEKISIEENVLAVLQPVLDKKTAILRTAAAKRQTRLAFEKAAANKMEQHVAGGMPLVRKISAPTPLSFKKK